MRTTIGESCSLHARIGWQGLTKKEYLDDGDYYLVTGTDFDQDRIAFEKCHYVTQDRYDQDKHIQLKLNDVLVTKDGTIGKVAFIDKPIDKPATLNSGVFVVRPNDSKQLTPHYLKWVLSSNYFAFFIERIKVGCTIPHLNQEKFLKFDFEIPSLPEQERIVAVLDSADRMIRLRRRELSLLDDLVKSRFVEMFGDQTRFSFEPLAENVKEMFIGPFGSSLKNDCFVDKKDGYCIVYEQKHAIQKTMNVPTRYVPKSKYEELKRFSVLPGDIIVSCRGTIGEIYVVPEGAPLGVMHPSIMKIRLNKEKYNQVFFVMALEKYMTEHIDQAKGSGVKMAVTASALRKELFIVPPMSDQDEFVEFVNHVEQMKASVQSALERSQLLFDALMQQYFG